MIYIPVYQTIAGLVQARQNCIKQNNAEWKVNHQITLRRLVEERLPSGGGFDSGTHLDFDKSTADKLVFTTSFHHMDQHGFYDGWTEHTVTVTASLAFGINIKVSGENRNDIIAYIAETFENALKAGM